VACEGLFSLHEDDPRLHDSAPDLLAQAAAAADETEVEAEVELVTREDHERCPTSPSHVGALRLILGQLDVTYRTVDVGVKEAIAGAIDSQPCFLTQPLAVPCRRRRQRLARPFLVHNPLHKSDVFSQGTFPSSFIFFPLKHHAPTNAQYR
jgi:hypothetical protein